MSGKNRCGTQRFLCRICQRTYTPQPKSQGYEQEVREKAVRMYVEGLPILDKEINLREDKSLMFTAFGTKR